jgi:membrane-associated protease RseP (regulator of RpoE activity)
MFATSLNLLPGGQLDGGHIVYALSPRSHKIVSRLTVLALIPLGIFSWAGWLIWAVLLLVSLMRHPPVPEYPDLDLKRKLLGWFALLMFVMTMLPTPFSQIDSECGVQPAGLWQMFAKPPKCRPW